MTYVNIHLILNSFAKLVVDTELGLDGIADPWMALPSSSELCSYSSVKKYTNEYCKEYCTISCNHNEGRVEDMQSDGKLKCTV